MSIAPLNVGFIGLNPDSHWAATAHLPALNALQDKFRIVGVANSTLASAKKTAAALNLPYAFATPNELVTSEEVDVVVITVKVPHHFALVSAALMAGKHVYCEWPLGNGLEEAQALAELAKEKGVVAVTGTQARAALEVQHVKKLIAQGYVGDVLSTSLIGSGGNWSNTTINEYYYLFQRENGANMQTIPLAHTLAAVEEVLGEFGDIDARFINHFDQVQITDTHEVKPKTTPDQIMIHGQLASGAALSVHYRGGVSRGTNLLWEINGTQGDIQVTGSLGHAQMIQLTVKGATGDQQELTELRPDSSLYQGCPDNAAARNIYRMYSMMYDDIIHGSHTAPSFADAVKLHNLIDSIEQSAGYNA